MTIKTGGTGKNAQLFVNVFHFASASCFGEKLERQSVELFSLGI